MFSAITVLRTQQQAMGMAQQSQRCNHVEYLDREHSRWWKQIISGRQWDQWKGVTIGKNSAFTLSGWNRTWASKGATDFAISETHGGVGGGQRFDLRAQNLKLLTGPFKLFTWSISLESISRKSWKECSIWRNVPLTLTYYWSIFSKTVGHSHPQTTGSSGFLSGTSSAGRQGTAASVGLSAPAPLGASKAVRGEPLHWSGTGLTAGGHAHMHSPRAQAMTTTR